VGQRFTTSVDKNKCATPASTFVQFNLFESNGAKKKLPAASKHADPGATIAYVEHPQHSGPGSTGASKWPPDPGGVGISKWSPDPGADGTNEWPPDPGGVETSEWTPDLGCGRNLRVGRPGGLSGGVSCLRA
jgi:hypothetical protein